MSLISDSYKLHQNGTHIRWVVVPEVDDVSSCVAAMNELAEMLDLHEGQPKTHVYEKGKAIRFRRLGTTEWGAIERFLDEQESRFRGHVKDRSIHNPNAKDDGDYRDIERRGMPPKDWVRRIHALRRGIEHHASSHYNR